MAVDRLMGSIQKGATFQDIRKQLDNAQTELINQAQAAAKTISKDIELDTATYDKDGNIVDNGVPQVLGELYVLHHLENTLLDQIRQTIASAQDQGSQRAIISRILEISSPNLYRTYNAGAQPGHTIADYRTNSKE